MSTVTPKRFSRVHRFKLAVRRRVVDEVRKASPAIAVGRADVSAVARTLEESAIEPLARFWELRSRTESGSEGTVAGAESDDADDRDFARE